MEEVLAIAAAQASKSRESQQTQSFEGIPERIPFIKKLTRKKSIFTLAAELFQPKKIEKAHVPIVKDEKQEKERPHGKSFLSLRNPRRSGKRVVDSGAVRCYNFSPKKSNESDFNKQKAMRRRSLQDLLGIVGTKLSPSRRSIHNENFISESVIPLEMTIEAQEIPMLVSPERALPDVVSKINTPLEVATDAQEISLLILPEPVLPLAGPPTDMLGSLCLYPKDKPSTRTADSDVNTEMDQGDAEVVSNRPKLQAKLSLRIISVAVQPAHAVDEIEPSESEHESQEFDGVSTSCSPEKVYHIIPNDFVRETRQRAPTRVRFLEKGDPPSEKMSDDWKETATSDNAKPDPSFPEKAPRGEKRYKSISDRPRSEEMELLPKHIEKTVAALGAVNMFGKLRQVTNHGTFSEDSSKTNTNDMSNYAWVENEMEVQNIIERGKDIMTFGPLPLFLHSSIVVEGRHTESFTSESLTISSAELQGMDDIMTQMISIMANPGKERVVSPETGELFRPGPENIGESAHISYPFNNAYIPYIKTYRSKSDAFEDLYQNHSGFSDFCLFDRNTRTYYPQAMTDLAPEVMESNDGSRELLWLPSEMFPVGSLSAEVDRKRVCSRSLNNHVSDEDVPSFNNSTDTSDSESRLLQATEIDNPGTATFNDENGAIARSIHHDNSYLEDGSYVEHIEFASSLEMGQMGQSSYTGPASETLWASTYDMDNSYDLVIDSAHARLYLGSQYSSTDSLQSVDEAGITYPISVSSILRKLNGAQSEKVKHVKTWIEMERDFLQKFAPGNQILPGRRRKVAVHEAFKKLRGLTDLSDDEGFDSGLQNSFDIEQERSLSSREAPRRFSFQCVDDKLECGLMKVEHASVGNSHQLLEDPSCTLRVDASSMTDVKDMVDELLELHLQVYTPPKPFAVSWGISEGRDVKQQAMYSGLSPLEDMWDTHNLDEDQATRSQDSETISLGSNSRIGSEDYSVTDTAVIPMRSGYMFTQYAEQLGECPADASQDSKIPNKIECDEQSIRSKSSECALNIAPNLSVSGNGTMPPLIELLGSDVGVKSDTDQLSVWRKSENTGLARTMTAHHCPFPVCLSLENISQRASRSSKAGWPVSIEAVRSVSQSKPCLETEKRVLTLTKHNPYAKVESSTQASQRLQCTSPSPSVADTEMSENFGEKLKRCECVEEEKENDHW